MQIQTLGELNTKLTKLLDSNITRSLSGVFKSLRKDKRISLFGDHPLLSFILRTAYSRTPRYVWNRSQVLRAIHTSGFYKETGKKHAYIPKEWEKYIKDE